MCQAGRGILLSVSGCSLQTLGPVEMGNGLAKQSFSSSSDAVTNSWLGNLFSMGSSSTVKGPGNPGGQVSSASV